MSGFFISYRRDDSGAEAHRLYERLSAHFGAASVFIDLETIEVGEDFAQVIEEKVGFCDALIAVIGTTWVTSADAAGRRRLDDPQDWVRLEIAAALSRGMKVIPVLVNGAALPGAAELPAPLGRLIHHQALDLRPRAFDRDVERLIAALERIGARGNAAVLWFSLVTRRHRALDPLDLHRPEVVWRALRFAMYMVLAGAVLRLPAVAAAGERYWSAGYAVTYLAANYVEWLAAGVALHVAMRMLGGRGTLLKSIAAFCFLSAYLPVIGLAQMPVWGLHVSVLKDVADIAWSPATASARLVQFTEQLGPFGVARIVMAFGAATVLWIILAAAVFEALRTLHRLGRARAIPAFVLGLAAYVVFLAFFYGPLIGAVYKTFELRG